MQEYTITIETLVSGGNGLGRLPDGKAVFVPFVLPGEVVRVRVREEKKSRVYQKKGQGNQSRRPVDAEQLVQPNVSFDPLDPGAKNELEESKHESNKGQDSPGVIQVLAKWQTRR